MHCPTRQSDSEWPLPSKIPFLVWPGPNDRQQTTMVRASSKAEPHHIATNAVVI